MLRSYRKFGTVCAPTTVNARWTLTSVYSLLYIVIKIFHHTSRISISRASTNYEIIIRPARKFVCSLLAGVRNTEMSLFTITGSQGRLAFVGKVTCGLFSRVLKNRQTGSRSGCRNFIAFRCWSVVTRGLRIRRIELCLNGVDFVIGSTAVVIE